MINKNTHKKALLLTGLALTSTSPAALLRITVEAPSNLGLAPAFISFHNGSNDLFDTGSTASAGLEALAETGDTLAIEAAFASNGNNTTIANGGPFFPGNSNSVTLDVDAANSTFSFAAMVLPSNDWFIGNNAGLDVSSILNGALGTSLTFDFSRVYDAGTEQEDFAFSPGNPIIGITTIGTPGGGTVQGEAISLVDGANPFAAFANQSTGFDPTTYDFNATSAILGRVTITSVPEPSSILLGSFGALGLLLRRRR